MKCKFWNLLILTILFKMSLAQPNPPKDIGRASIAPSPQAESFAIYSAIPVNYYSGLPKIDIPLFNISLINFDLGLGVSYHSGGIKQNDEASIVGLNWTLNAGGTISRMQRHKDDLSTSGYFRINPNSRTCSDNVDQEPDVFYYNFTNHSGQFIFEYNPGNYKITEQVKSGLKITFDDVNDNFTIVDENGVTYEFKQKEYTNSVCDSDGLSFDETIISSWFLTKLTTPSNQTIEFNYEYTANRFKRAQSVASMVKASSYYPSDLFSGAYDPQVVANYGNYILGMSFRRVTYTYVSELVLSSIVFNYGAIKFTYTGRSDILMTNPIQGAKKLYKIDVLQGSINGPALKEYILGYDHYSSGSSQPSYLSTRLRLKSISEKAKFTTLSPYEFLYDGDYLPDKDPGDQILSFLSGDYLGNIGLISKITYPGGGTTEFEFEGNGPCRIKKTKQHDSQGYKNYREYIYEGARSFSGMLAHLVGSSSTHFTTHPVGAPNTPIPAGITLETTIHNSKTKIGSSNGYISGYDKVTELIGESGIGGKIEIEFHNEEGIQATLVPTFVPNLNGYPKKRVEFENINGSFSPRKTVFYNYELYHSQNHSISMFVNSGCSAFGYDYECNTIALSDEEEIDHMENNINVSRQKEYAYGNILSSHIQPTMIKESSSKGDILVTENKYAGDLSDAVSVKMVAKNLAATLVKQRIKVNSLELESHTVNFYDWFSNGNVLMPISMTSNYQGNTGNTTIFSRYDNNGNILEFKKEDGIVRSLIWGYNNQLPIAEITGSKYADVYYTSFEDDGNSSIGDAFTGLKSRKDGFSKSLTGLTNGDYKLTYWMKNGTDWTFIETSVPVTSGVYDINIPYQIDELRFYPKNAEIKTSTYNAFTRNITSICNTANDVEYYDYDSFGRLTLVRDKDKNILKRECYVDNDATVLGGTPCSIIGNVEKILIYNKSCQPCQVGSSVEVKVQTNTFWGTSQNEADSKALDYILSYGQEFANINGICRAPNSSDIVSLQASNQTNEFLTINFSSSCTGGKNYSFSVNPNSSTIVSVEKGNYQVTMVSMGSKTFSIGGQTLSTYDYALFTNVIVQSAIGAQVTY